MRLEELQIVVTGAASGLGRHFAVELVRAGARVAAGDLNAAGLRSLRGEVQGLPGELVVAPLDVADEASVTSFVAEAAKRLDGLNALINNAGILRDGLLIRRDADDLATLPLAQWRKVLDVNLTGAFLMIREVAASILRDGRHRGVIVNISSLARAGNPGQSNYAASKAGLDAATRTWALELSAYGIRVCGVSPGVTRTPILEGISDQAMAALVAGIPIGRIATPDEVWQAVRFAIEDEFFNGRVLEIDGGASMG